MIKKTTENSFAASTLNPKSMDHDKMEVIAMNYFMKMNDAQKQRHLDMVQKMLASAWSKPGAGAPDASEKNRRFNKEEFDLMEFDNSLSECLDDMGFEGEHKQRFGELFYEAVEQRLFHGDDAFRAKVIEILNDYAPSPFISDEQLDVAEMLANRIQILESHIEAVESESDELAEEINQQLQEEADLLNNERPLKRSTIEQHLFEADENNADNLYNEEQQQKFLDGNMRAYLNALDRTQR